MATDGREELFVKLHPTSFRGVRFFVASVTTTGGRKAFERPIVNSDEQIVDDVGMKQDSFTVNGYVTAIYEGMPSNEIGISTTYVEQRERILEALRQKTPATFVHPVAGRIDRLVAKSWTLDERVTEVGIGPLSIEFVKETVQPTPVIEEGNAEAVEAAGEAADDALLSNLEDEWVVEPSFVDSYADAVGKLSDVFSAINEAADSVETTVDAIASTATKPLAEFAQTIGNLQSTVASAAAIGTKTALAVRTAFAALSTVFATPGAYFQAMLNLFDFGDLDVSFDVTTPSGRQRKRNFDAMNSAVKGVSLSNAYRAATSLEYVTTDDIALVESALDKQHRSVVDSGLLDLDSIDALSTARDEFSRFIEQTKLTARKIVEDDVPRSTPRVLAYLLYEDEADEFSELLANLNGAVDYELLGGTARILSS